MEIVSLEDNVHDMLNPFLQKKIFASFAHTTVIVNVLCFQHLSESRFLFGTLHRRSKFTNFCNDLMQNHLS